MCLDGCMITSKTKINVFFSKNIDFSLWGYSQSTVMYVNDKFMPFEVIRWKKISKIVDFSLWGCSQSKVMYVNDKVMPFEVIRWKNFKNRWF